MIRFRMCRINVNQFALLVDRMPEQMGMNLEIEYLIEEEHKMVACRISETFKDGEEKIMILKITCEYAIHPEDWDAMSENGKIILTQEAMEIFAAQAVGTSRGVLFCKTEGTCMNGICLPPVNVREIIQGK